MTTAETTTEVWYVIEWSYKDADDWFTTSSTCDSEESARNKLAEHRQMGPKKSGYSRLHRKIQIRLPHRTQNYYLGGG